MSTPEQTDDFIIPEKVEYLPPKVDDFILPGQAQGPTEDFLVFESDVVLRGGARLSEWQRHMAKLDKFSLWMDGKYLGLGLDPFLDFIPVFGDIVTTVISLYVVWDAAKLGIPKRMVAAMLAWVVLDTLVSTGIPLSTLLAFVIPPPLLAILLGAEWVIQKLLDFGIRANRENVKILRAYYQKLLAEKGLTEPALPPGR